MNGDEAVRPMNDLRPPNPRYRLTLAASLAAAALLYAIDFPNLGTDHTLED